MARQAVQTTFAPVAGVKLPRPFQTSVAAEQWLTSTRNPSSIGNPSTVFFRSISTDGCRAARPLDLVLVDWDWVTWTWTDPSPSQGEDKVCNVIYDIILFDIGFLFKISIYISNSSLSDSELSSWRTSSSQKSKVTVVTPQCDKVTDHCIGQLGTGC